MTFSLILASEKRKKMSFFFSFLGLLTNKYKKKKNENLIPFFVLFAVQTNSCFSFSVTIYEVVGGRGVAWAKSQRVVRGHHPL